MEGTSELVNGAVCADVKTGAPTYARVHLGLLDAAGVSAVAVRLAREQDALRAAGRHLRATEFAVGARGARAQERERRTRRAPSRTSPRRR